ncbi:uncharacterized protein TTMY_0582 [Thermus thermophilus]|uniref:hypothetical protein n=1 Tax=Thermus thermophilus TaxID=274 RepID=UPI00090C5AAF|nr:hypothetical protein [Thermus thermophilus]BAW00992.1 uncharacterized protein TTMY_0582 [Thermus thermophilus]BDB11676.1 hypothetical protein TthTMY_14150 [Thermus thermophilus]
MRRVFWPLVALAGLLAACSVSFTIPLPDQTVQLPALGGTLGRVVYPAQAQSFPPPGGVLKDVQVTGTLEASQPLSLTLDLYARTKDPAQDENCLALGGYAYACALGPEDGPIGRASFAGTSAPLSLKGEKLTQGVQEGRLWLGAMVQGLPNGGLTLTFKNLKATLTLGL